jgi:CheY-like chemotaxis protein
LTIAKHLVELMGGTIYAYSALGRGSMFVFTAWFGVSAATGTYRKPLPKEMKGVRMLVVDDNAAAREILFTQLRSLDFSVSTVASGREAIDIIKEAQLDHPFDAVFIDWKMPDLDGIETTKRIRALKQSPKLIMVTAFGRDEANAQAEAAGIDAFLVKPVSSSALLDTILKLFGTQIRPSSQSAKTTDGIPPLRGMHILIAEDNEINQQIATELLKDWGATSVITRDGQEAVNKLHTDPTAYDAILMDIQMPVLDGIEATRIIRSESRFRKLPIIAMTAHALPTERERCLAAGMTDHITKPLDPHSMLQILIRWTRPADSL